MDLMLKFFLFMKRHPYFPIWYVSIMFFSIPIGIVFLKRPDGYIIPILMMIFMFVVVFDWHYNKRYDNPLLF